MTSPVTGNSFMGFQGKDHVRDENLAFEKKDGGQILVEFISSVYKVDGRRVIQCNIRDITQRRRAELCWRGNGA